MPSITKQIMSGAKWTSISTMCITIIQIVQFALLGNMMTLTEFGLVGMITTVTVFAQIVLDMGFGAALIQRDDATERQLSTLYWLNIMTGVLLFVLLYVSSPVIAGFYQREEPGVFGSDSGDYVFDRANWTAISVYAAKAAAF